MGQRCKHTCIHPPTCSAAPQGKPATVHKCGDLVPTAPSPGEFCLSWVTSTAGGVSRVFPVSLGAADRETAMAFDCAKCVRLGYACRYNS